MAVDRAQPLALLLGSVAYFYSSITNVVNMRPMSNSTLVETNYGILRGTKDVSRGGKSFYEFLGVPYALPPIGQLRFEPPVKPEKWNGIRDATRYGNRCWQYERVTRSLGGDENCLFCNVFTPKIQHPNEENRIEPLLPVIVFIHGGLFMAGYSNLYRPKYFMDEDVVLVTLNYRLASFGFLNTGDDVVRGNMGLKDQTMALKWVQENIKYFGGDPNRVTIVGQSAGGASVHLHMLSPMSKGLFSQAISQSGSALAPWALVNRSKEQAQLLGRHLNCPTVTSKAMVDCLKSKSARQIARSHIGYIKLALDERESVYGPTIESTNDSSTFLAQHPRELLEQGDISSKVPWINGVTSEEGLIYLISLIRNETRRSMVNNDWEKYAPILFNYEEHPNKDNISHLIRDYYLGNKTIQLNTLKDSVNMFSDRGFFEDSRDSAIMQSRHSPVYSYFYTYEAEVGMANILFARTPLPLPETLDFAVGSTLSWFSSTVLRLRERNHYGVCHSDEISMLFNIPLLSREIVPGESDYRFSKSFVGLWASFAKHGFPDTSSLFYGATWNAIDSNASEDKPLQRLKLDQNAAMVDEPFFERIQFWKSLNLSTNSIS